MNEQEKSFSRRQMLKIGFGFGGLAAFGRQRLRTNVRPGRYAGSRNGPLLSDVETA